MHIRLFPSVSCVGCFVVGSSCMCFSCRCAVLSLQMFYSPFLKGLKFKDREDYFVCVVLDVWVDC